MLWYLLSFAVLLGGWYLIDKYCIGSRKTYDATGLRGNEFWVRRNRKYKRNK